MPGGYVVEFLFSVSFDEQPPDIVIQRLYFSNNNSLLLV